MGIRQPGEMTGVSVSHSAEEEETHLQKQLGVDPQLQGGSHRGHGWSPGVFVLGHVTSSTSSLSGLTADAANVVMEIDADILDITHSSKP